MSSKSMLAFMGTKGITLSLIAVQILLSMCNMKQKSTEISFGQDISGISLGLQYHEDTIEHSINLDVFIRNERDTPIYFISTHFLKNFFIDITNSKQERLEVAKEKSETLRQILESETHRRVSVEIKPGEIYLVNPGLSLLEWYALDASEEYQIQVTVKEGLVEDIHPKSPKINLTGFSSLIPHHPWPQKNNPIIAIEYELIIGLGDEGQHIYQSGKVEDMKEIEAVQAILEPLRPHLATLTAKPMGKVHLWLADGEKITLLPIFHLPLDQYKDLFKVNNMDCMMPEPLADILNNWRAQLIEKK